jgi:hypothetical protein
VWRERFLDGFEQWWDLAMICCLSIAEFRKTAACFARGRVSRLWIKQAQNTKMLQFRWGLPYWTSPGYRPPTHSRWPSSSTTSRGRLSVAVLAPGNRFLNRDGRRHVGS